MAENNISGNAIGGIVRKAEQDWISGYTQKSQYVQESLYADISKIEAYLNSKHTSGDTDSLGREKPFFNICLAVRNIWFRATDLDRKNISVRDKNVLLSLIAKLYLQAWMDKADFGTFLNSWGLNSAAYNESVVKFVEQDGELKCMVVPWSRLICDSIDFASNPVIEVLELTPAQLRQKEGYDQELVKKLLETRAARQNANRQNKDNKNEYIKLYEIHGELPLSYLTGKEEDDEEFVQQMHVLTFIQSKEKGSFDDYCLISGRETKNPYMLTALLPEVDGSVGLNGSVKNLFEAQWMQNHSIKAIKDHLDLANKLIFQTSDGNFVGQNALTSIESGDILIHAVNQPLTQFNNSSHDITSMQNFQNQWKVLSNEISGISEAMLGQNPPAGSAWRQTEALLAESHSLFEVMTENRGLAVERMFREFIGPYIKKRLRNTKELVAVLEANDIKKIDSKYIKSETIKRTNQDIVNLVLKDEDVTPEEQMMLQKVNEMGMQEALNEQENVRTFKPSEVESVTWADVFKDFEWNVKVDVTGENSNTQEEITTITTLLNIIGNNPMALNNPAFAYVFNRGLTLTGTINPIELEQVVKEAQNMPQPIEQVPAQGGAVGGTSLPVNPTQQNVR
jgi:hypothetical protein